MMTMDDIKKLQDALVEMQRTSLNLTQNVLSFTGQVTPELYALMEQYEAYITMLEKMIGTLMSALQSHYPQPGEKMN